MGAPRHELGWSEDRVALLKKRWAEGASAAQIARELQGGVTRNAVIAKVHRLGLSNRATPSAPTRSPTRPKVSAPAVPRSKPGISAATRLAAAQGAPVPVLAPPQELAPDPTIGREPLRLDILELGKGQCKWPLGKVSPFTFCGLRAAGESPYCAEHERIARPGPAPGRRPVGEKELIRSVRRFI